MTKVVHITTSSKTGAGIAALRLHKALRQAGVASAYLSKNVTIGFNGNEMKDPLLHYKKPSFLKKIILKISRLFFTSKRDAIKRALSKKGGNYEIVSIPFSKYKLHKHPIVMEADIVHLHWVGLILDYPSFFKSINKPLVWTLHDANPFMGLFHYKNDWLQNSGLQKLDANLQKIKKDAVNQLDKITVVSPSRWLLQDAKESGLFTKATFLRIPNSINTLPVDNSIKLKKEYGINNGPVLLCVAGSLNTYRKGMDLLIKALELIKRQVTLVTIGKGTLKIKNKHVKVIPLGFMVDEVKIRNCYAMADAFVIPSREDNLPNTMLESLSVGTPVIGFSIGGLKEHIVDFKNGILAPTVSETSLEKAITRFLNEQNKFDRAKIKKNANVLFDPNKQAKAYLNIYNKK